jgi:uncharacterized protein (DUF58 family)
MSMTAVVEPRTAGGPAGLARRVAGQVRRAARALTAVGWALLGLGMAAWLAGLVWGWAEAAAVAGFAWTAVAVSALFAIGRTRVAVGLAVSPQRVRVGQSALARFEVSNTSAHRQGPVSLRLPVGVSAAYLTTVPALTPGASHTDQVTIATSRRGVFRVGPVMTQRGDPLGIIRRQVAWTAVAELFVHPELVALEPIGAGVLRDLEGQSTPEVSYSDLAFHALRPYVPGDDRRYIHWRSSARLSALSGQTQFMVRQFLDTRRTHLAVVSDLDRDHFGDADEFEIALSAAASVARRALDDAVDLTVLCGQQVRPHARSPLALDAYCRAEWGPWSLAEQVERVQRLAPDASIVVVVTGGRSSFDDHQRGRFALPYAVRMVVVKVDRGAPIGLRQADGLTEVTIGALADLPRALGGAR